MNFKRLELYGFKSFADRTIIEFNEGLTGIVGPNGSGKSNFSDAIKWVLGEQSAKQLRGKSMQDVIFDGTQRRSKMSYCEVTLVFDNTDQKIFKTLVFDEVSFTRKLYRSGESEYLLNGTPVLLKNLRDIIRDTGLGKDGYSIIGQGRVDEIINSKPENRRAIFEEAAGISKYKKRKEDSEDKLEKTRDHISRINDILKEIERQLTPLQKQAENAKKFFELHGEMKELEINHFLFAYDNNDKEIEKIRNVITAISEEIELVKTKIKQNDDNYYANLDKIQKIEDDLNEYRELRTKILLANQEKLGKGETLQERLNNAKNEEKNLLSDIEKNVQKIADCDELLINFNHKKSEISAIMSSLKGEYDEKEKQLLELTDKINSKTEELEHSEKAMFEAIEKLTDANTDYTKLETNFEYLKQDKLEQEEYIKSLKENIQKTEEERQALDKERNLIQTERNEIYRELASCKKNNTENSAKIALLDGNITEIKRSLASYEMQRTILDRAKNQYDSYQGAVKRIMQHTKEDAVLDSKILGVVAELIKVPEKYETAIEMSLGASMQNIVAANTEDVKYCINVLKKYRMGVVTFLPMNALRPRVLVGEQQNILKERGVLGLACDLIDYDKSFAPVFKNLLGSTVVCDTYDNADTISKKYNRAIRIVTLEGEMFNPQGSISGGGTRKQDSVGLLGRERELENLVKNIANAKSSLEKNTEEYQICVSNGKKLTFLIENLNEQLMEKEVQYNTSTNKVDSISDVLDEMTDELAQKSETYNELCDKLELIAVKLSGAGKLKSDISTQKNTFDDKKEKSKEILNKMVEDRSVLSSQLSQIKERYSAESNRFTLCETDINHQIKAKTEAQNNKIFAQSNLENVRRHIADTENQINNAVLSEADKAKVDEIDGKIAKLTSEKSQLNDLNQNIIAEKDKNNDQLQTASNRKTKEEGNIEKLRVQFENLTNRIREEYKLEYEDCLPFRIEDFNDGESLQQIAHLKRAISALGEIVPSSIEAYAELNERYTTLTAQKEDLVESESKLLGLLNDLSKEMQDIFDTEFSKISKNFQTTFRDIFGGGSGKLFIDPDAEDPLTAGVLIEANLPGKNTRNLASLSGGERALTAIAILFSILKTKPMPFCLLDEIEAALDDSNVALFAKYLKKFVTNTQFIVITHRKPTMEQADRLFGVTMEERGVSKVVSIELAEAVKNVTTD